MKFVIAVDPSYLIGIVRRLNEQLLEYPMTPPISRNGVSLSTRLVLSPQTTLQPLGDTEGGVVLKLDSGELFTINDTSLAFLQELDGATSIDDVAGRLAEIFDIDAATLTSDLVEIADDLIDESLIHIV